MAVVTGPEIGVNACVDAADLKTKVVVNHVELEVDPKPPVSDDFMYDFKYNHALPTNEVLGTEIPHDCDALKEASSILACLSKVMGEGDSQGFTDLFLEYGESLYRRQGLNVAHFTRRGMAGQVVLHMGLSYLQFSTGNLEGRHRPFPYDKGHQLQISGPKTFSLPPIL